MQKRWVVVLFFFMIVITAVSIMQAVNDQHGGGGAPGPALATLNVGPHRRILLHTKLKLGSVQTLYYTVEDHGKMVQEASFFGSLGINIARPKFVTYHSKDGNLVGVAEKVAPQKLLILYDFASGESWPRPVGDEVLEVWKARGQKLLDRLQADQPAHHFQLLATGKMQPLPVPK